MGTGVNYLEAAWDRDNAAPIALFCLASWAWTNLQHFLSFLCLDASPRGEEEEEKVGTVHDEERYDVQTDWLKATHFAFPRMGFLCSSSQHVRDRLTQS
jgi:hypothetical protein